MPLASKHKEHYSQLLMCYYSLFETYSIGVEKELVVSSFEEYFSEDSGLVNQIVNDLDDLEQPESSTARALASLFLRKLISYGWMSEEILRDFTPIINITLWARPFYLAIRETVNGISVEYESHVIGIYSSLCSDVAKENGHHAVLNAMDHTRKLIDSLKTLSQNIKTHIERMFKEDAEVRELLHIHYDLYMQEIVDKAYTRLKTSDNLSRYRPRIIREINTFIEDQQWLVKSASRLAVIQNSSEEKARQLLISMLLEIRDELKNIDPILEEIDDKNRQYSRISTEKIKAHIYADSSLQGKIQTIIESINTENSYYKVIKPKIVNSSSLTAASLYTPRTSRGKDAFIAYQEPEEFDMELMETEMHMKILNQLSPKKIRTFLDEHCPTDGTPVSASEMIESMEDFIRVMYAAAYAEGRESHFPYRIVWKEHMITIGRFTFKEHTFTPIGETDDRT